MTRGPPARQVKTGGVLVVGELSVTYLSGTDFKSIPTPLTRFRAYEPIDDVRYLLADSLGGLHVLVLDAPDRGPCALSEAIEA